MITCYRDLHAFLRKRADSLGISRARIDELAGLPVRYAATVLAPDGAKRMSLDVALAIIGALGCSVSIVEDADAMRLKRGEARASTLDSVGSRDPGKVTASRKASRARKQRKLLRDLAKLANVARNLKLSPAERSRIASIAARARHKANRRQRRSVQCPKSGTAGCPQTGKALRLSRSN